MNHMMDDAEISRLEARHGLMSYQFHYLRGAANFISFEGKTVLEVGGSLPRDLVFDELGVKKWICVQEYEYWDMLPESQGLERLAVVEQENCVYKIENACEITELPEYAILDGAIERLPKHLYNSFDIVYSAAAFEHILNFPDAIDTMYHALKENSDLFSCFSPVWTAHNGHHLPDVVDAQGKEFNFKISPIPNWGHLLLRPAELYRLLLRFTDPDAAGRIVFYVYNSPHIN